VTGAGVLMSTVDNVRQTSLKNHDNDYIRFHSTPEHISPSTVLGS
jgi:hypothetical protein